jgi:TPR repeat protein
MLHYLGEGVKQDYPEAARQFQAPAAAGNDQAQFYLGSMYSEGQGVEKNEAKAIAWLSKSAAQRNTRAMGMLATSLFSRHRDEHDLIDAYAWAHLAAESDPIQASTSAREVIAQYCSEAQKKQGQKVMAEWKKKWAAEDQARH